MGHSYREQVTAQHDAFCIAHALQSYLENCADNNEAPTSFDVALEHVFDYIAEGVASCYCRLVSLQGEAKFALLNNFSDDAVVAMAQGGYRNDSTGELMTLTWEEYLEFHAYRTERYNHREAEYLANEIAGDPNSWDAVIASDTEPQPSYSLLVDGKKSEHATWVSKWGIAYGVVRELQANGIDPDSNTGIITAVLETLDNETSVVTAGIEFSTTFEGN